MNLFTRRPKKIDILKAILDELIEINKNVKEIQSEVSTTNWNFLSLEDDIKKLKEKNKNLQNQLKEKEGNHYANK